MPQITPAPAARHAPQPRRARSPELPDPLGLYRTALDAMPASTCVLDDLGRIVWVNDAWVRFAEANGSRDGQHYMGSNYLTTCEHATGEGAGDAHAAARAIRQVLQQRHEHTYLDYPCHAPNTARWFQLRVQRFVHANRDWVLICHENITERKRAELAYQHAAEHDPLTGLANRALLTDQLQRVIRDHDPFTLLFIDFDRFKLINDTLGHDVGDMLLQNVGQRLRDTLDQNALAARLGGDEVVVLLRGEAAAEHAALDTAEQLRAVLGRAHRVHDHQVNPSVSIGVVRGAAGEYRQPNQILRDADVAMYEAKAAGGDRALLFDATLREQGLQRLRDENRLRTGQ